MFRIATFPIPDYIEPCALKNLTSRPNCWNPGALAEVLFNVLDYGNIPYQLEPYHKIPAFGEFVNNSWQGGLFEKLQNGSIDLIANLWIETALRKKTFEFSFPIVNDQLAIFYAASGSSSLYLLLGVFSPSIWLALLLTFGLMAAVFVFLLLLTRKHGEKQIWYRILWVLFGLSTVVFVNLYASALLTQLLHPIEEKLIKDENHMLKMLEKKQIYFLMAYDDDFMYQSIEFSEKPFYKSLRKTLEKNPAVFEPNQTRFKMLFSQGKFVYPGMASALSFLKLYTSCKAQGVKAKEMPIYRKNFMFRKDSPWLPQFNRILVQKQQQIETIIKKYEGRIAIRAQEHCQKENAAASERKALSLISLTGVFGLYSVGFLTAACIFASEIAKFHSKPKPKLSSQSNANSFKLPLKLTVTIESGCQICARNLNLITRLYGSTLKPEQLASFACSEHRK